MQLFLPHVNEEGRRGAASGVYRSPFKVCTSSTLTAYRQGKQYRSCLVISARPFIPSQSSTVKMPTTPHRNRLNLYMDFTTPSRPSTPSPNPRATFLSPQNIPHYSASRRSSHYSSMIKAPSSSSGTTQYSSSDDEADHEQTRKRYTWLRVKRSHTGRVFVVWILLCSLFTWYCLRGRSNLDTIKTGVGEFTFKSVLFQDAATKGLQFIPAAHPRIHVRHFSMHSNRC